VRNPKAALFCLLFLACFLLVVLFRSSFAVVDAEVNFWAASNQIGFFTDVAKGIDLAFDTISLAILTLAVGSVLLILRLWKESLLLGSAMIGDALLVSLAKLLVQSPRPLNELIPEGGYSFPSGHVTGSIVLLGVLTYLAWHRWSSPKAKAATGTIYVTVTVLVGFDRVYLNVHWFSDVVGGAFLGAMWLAFSLFAFECLNPSRNPVLAAPRVLGKT
jgi:undecaprenyl-diphosphatase